MISTLGGLFNLNHFDQSSRANDVIVIRHKDGTLHSTPFNVRFGRAQIWSNQGRVVQVEVNGDLTTAVMKIGKGGEAYWLQPTYGTFGEAGHHGGGGGSGAGRKKPRAPGGAAPARHTNAAGAGSGSGAGAGGGGGSGVMTDEAALMLQTVGTLGSTVGEGETLSIDDAELQHLPIRPESPPAPPAAAAPPQSPAPAAPASSLVVPGPPDSAAGGGGAAGARRGGDGPLTEHHAGSQDSVANLPLLHTADDGHLTVETRAIHSAGDAQEARLALRAMAAAEKSRKRLLRMGLAGDAYLLKSAQEEGQVGDDDDDGGDEGGGDVAENSGGVDAAAAAAATLPAAGAAAAASVVNADHAELTSPMPAVAAGSAGGEQESSVTSTPPAASTATAAAAAPSATSPPATAPHDAGGEDKSGTAAAGAPEPTAPALSPPTGGAARAPSSAASRSGSTDNYKVEDEDAYFLDPIEADDDYAAGLYGADGENLLGSASFASSVTSGVSLPDGPPGLGYGAGSADSSPGAAPGSGRGKAGRYAGPAAPPTSTPPGVPTRLLRPGSAPFPSSPDKTPTAENRQPGPTGKDAGDAALPTASSRRAFSGASGSFGNADEVVDAEGRPVRLLPSTGVSGGGPYFARTLIPVEADLWKLRLREGCNAVRYLARKDKGDIVAVSCNIFLWNWTDRLVVSDVDGTITKSDLLGHFYAMLGKGADWTHPGICNLYSKIEGNGYRMVYLTARSVSQINQTKTYLFTLQQDGVRLPMGPVLTAPQRFFTALTQEVSKQSHVFKIACLTSVRAAFPPTTKPFFAGFGNRYNDVISYDAAGIPTHKIFIIDPSSVLHVCLVRQTYRDLGHLVDVTFPPVKRHPVVLRAPRHLQRAGEAEASGAGGAVSAAAGHASGNSGGGRRSGQDRHAYARGLLHRSASASSSSSFSVSSVTSDSSDVGEYVSGEASDAGSVAPPCLPAAPRGSEEDAAGGGTLPRHASAAFSLVNSVRVDVGDAGAGVHGGEGVETSKPVASSGTTTAVAAAAAAAASTPAGAQRGTAAIPSSSAPQPPQPAAASPLPGAGAKPTVAPANTRRGYNRGQRATFSDLNNDHDEHGDDRHTGSGVGVAVHEKEEVPADPEFSSYAFWRMDPRDLISATPAKAPSKPSDKKMLPAVATSNSTKASLLSPNGGGALAGRGTQAKTPDRSPVHGPAAAPSISPIPTPAAKAPASGSHSGAVSRGNTAAVASGYGDGEGSTTGPVEDASADVAVSGSRIELPQPAPGSQEPLPPPPAMQAAALLPSAAAAGGAAAKESSGGSGGGGRGFFASFSFSRARPVEAPPSPHTQRVAQLREEAKRRALSHPDAREYYYAAQSPASPLAPPSSSGASFAASPRGTLSEPASPKQ